MVSDFFPLPRVCDGCGGDIGARGSAAPTHVHEAADAYFLVEHTPGHAKDETGSVATVYDGGATVFNATAGNNVTATGGLRCDHGSYGFPKSFFDPVKQRRLQYGWTMGGKFEGEDGITFLDTAGRNLTVKSNHQSLLREITYDPRLGMLYFLPVEELKLLRGPVLAAITAPTKVPPNGVLPLPTPPLLANQSEVRVSFAVPTQAVTFGVRVMTNFDCPGGKLPDGAPCPPRNLFSQGMSFSVGFDPAPSAGAAAWSVSVGTAPDRHTKQPVGRGRGSMPILHTDEQIEMLLYVDQTVVEAYFAGGRYALTEVVQAGSMLPQTRGFRPGSLVGNNTWQGVEVFASGPGVTVLNASVWQMADAWSDVATHGRPHHK